MINASQTCSLSASFEWLCRVCAVVTGINHQIDGRPDILDNARCSVFHFNIAHFVHIQIVVQNPNDILKLVEGKVVSSRLNDVCGILLPPFGDID